MGTRKLGPAVAAGCTVGDQTGRSNPADHAGAGWHSHRGGTTKRRGECDHDIPIRRKSTSPIIADPRLRKLTFTGSTRLVAGSSSNLPQQVLKTSMELGGNAPFLVFSDADLDKALEGAMLAKMRNIGEACTAANRFLVHESLAQQARQSPGGADGCPDHRPGRRGRRPGRPLIDTSAVEKVDRS